ncbi:MAG: NAD(+) synthase, partial [Clostridia bacterium]|nr:NAD(+) synthase [Clostridia bacterium]
MKREEKNGGTKIPLSEEIISSMKCYFKKAGATTAVVGVSGGKDSSVVAALAVMALGPMNVQLVYLPDQFPAVKVNPGTPENNRLFDPDVLKLAECLKVKNGNVWSWSMAHVEGAVHAGAGKLKEAARINLLPRLRTAMLYFHAQQIGSSLVLNTSNLDEKYVGYFTIGGD